jgi:hypothetical protein
MESPRSSKLKDGEKQGQPVRLAIHLGGWTPMGMAWTCENSLGNDRYHISREELTSQGTDETRLLNPGTGAYMRLCSKDIEIPTHFINSCSLVVGECCALKNILLIKIAQKVLLSVSVNMPGQLHVLLLPMAYKYYTR